MMKLILPLLLATSMFLNIPQSNATGNGEPGDQSQKPLFSFGIITDIHNCNCEPENSRFYRLSLPRLKEAVNSLKADSAEFLINLGDMIDRDIASYGPVLDLTDSSGLKTWYCLGNHDYSVETRYKKRLPVPLPEKTGYYSFMHGNFRFIILNGNELSTYASGNKASIKEAEEYIAGLKAEGNVNAVDWNGGIGSKQLTWLKSQLDDAAAKNEKVFIACHFPAWPENVHNLLNYKEVLSVLENYQNVIAWFSGHNHAGNYGNFNMIHFVTLKGMVETEKAGAYSLVEVYRNKIWIKGSGRERSQILAY
jgi:manganese-dependent ADP-ribose/CDP-alcohol diphosphatase